MSKELFPVLKAQVERHLDDKLPVIIGGESQQYRAEISAAYGKWLADTCKKNNIRVIEARPWNTVLKRAIEGLLEC